MRVLVRVSIWASVFHASSRLERHVAVAGKRLRTTHARPGHDMKGWDSIVTVFLCVSRVSHVESLGFLKLVLMGVRINSCAKIVCMFRFFSFITTAIWVARSAISRSISKSLEGNRESRLCANFSSSSFFHANVNCYSIPKCFFFFFKLNIIPVFTPQLWHQSSYDRGTVTHVVNIL